MIVGTVKRKWKQTNLQEMDPFNKSFNLEENVHLEQFSKFT